MRARTIATAGSLAVIGALTLRFVGGTAPLAAQQRACLHGPDESAGELGRRRQALMLARAINTAESIGSSKNGGSYLPLADLQIAIGVPAGFDAQLSTDGKGYTFSVKDKTDACHFAFFSDQAGVIYNATPIQ